MISSLNIKYLLISPGTSQHVSSLYSGGDTEEYYAQLGCSVRSVGGVLLSAAYSGGDTEEYYVRSVGGGSS